MSKLSPVCRLGGGGTRMWINSNSNSNIPPKQPTPHAVGADHGHTTDTHGGLMSQHATTRMTTGAHTAKRRRFAKASPRRLVPHLPRRARALTAPRLSAAPPRRGCTPANHPALPPDRPAASSSPYASHTGPRLLATGADRASSCAITYGERGQLAAQPLTMQAALGRPPAQAPRLTPPFPASRPVAHAQPPARRGVSPAASYTAAAKTLDERAPGPTPPPQ